MSSTDEDSRAETPERGRSGARPYVLASLAPALVWVAGYFLVAELAQDAARTQLLRSGVALGVVAGWLVGLGVAVWMRRAVTRGGSAFLAPMAGGFLAKLLILGVGTLLLARPLARFGDHLAFALCFVAAVFGFQLLFTPSLHSSNRVAAPERA